MISILFDVQRLAITKCLKNIFETDELVENQVYSIFDKFIFLLRENGVLFICKCQDHIDNEKR
jgi:hypothetical protein